MKKDKKTFLVLKRRVLKYNKALIYTFIFYMFYALVHSISILDCKGINYYTYNGKVTSSMLTCDNFSSRLLAFFRNNNTLICLTFLIIAIVLMILQKINLLKVNKLGVKSLNGEKVIKKKHILYTLLLGYTGIHKYQTQNIIIGKIYALNFVLFVISWFIKIFFNATYHSYLIIYCTFEFGLLFLIGIIILNIIEAITSLLSKTDSEDKIFA